MAQEPEQDDAGLRGVVRRTVGKVTHTLGDAASGVTEATAEKVIEDLEPYLISEAVPRIVDGVMPYLSQTVVPDVLAGVQDHLVEHTVPEVVDGVTAHLVDVTVPKVLEGVMPTLVQDLLPQILNNLRPYLEADLVPDIVDALTPRLTGVVVPRILDELMPKITEEVAPQLIEALMPTIEQEVAPQLIDSLMPKIRDDVAPKLIDALMPSIRDDVAPQLIDALMPKIEQEVAPQLIDALMPKITEDVAPKLIESLMPTIERDVAPKLIDALLPSIRDDVAPQLIDALMPKIEQDVAPQLIDALMPKIEQEVAPKLVDSLLPKIRNEVVPEILEDIVDDPSVRDLIREQSQGLVLDALESIRENIADVDNIVERIIRKLLRRPPRPEPESGLQIVLDAADAHEKARTTLASLADQRKHWAEMGMPPAPPGREFAYAGVITRLASFALDVTLSAWIVSQGLSALLSLLTSLFGKLPQWAVLTLSGIAAMLVPLYLALAWSIVGRSLGSFVVGTRVCTADGHRPGFFRALIRAWLEVLGYLVFLITFLTSFFDDRRRTVMDMVARTEVRFVVPREQQNRYIRDALAKRKKAEEKDAEEQGTAQD